MKLCNQIKEYVAAAFSGIYITSFEHDDAIQEIAAMCSSMQWTWALWDITRGLQPAGVPNGDDSPDPVAAVKSLRAMASNDATILVLKNFHKFMDNVEVLQALEIALSEGKQMRTFIVILSPILNLPVELQRQFVIVDHQLPDREELNKILASVATEASDLPANSVNTVLDASAGLTRLEAEGAYALSLVRHSVIKPDVIWEIKSAGLKKSGLLTLHQGKENFESLGGLNRMKKFCKGLLTKKHTNTKTQPKGVMYLGVSGTGKSAFAKALGNEVGRPTITLDLGALMGSLVGETERNTRQALAIIDAMAPCILFCDEVEKSLSGATGGSNGDSGVSTRMFGTLLTWLNDHESDVFFVATSNDISKLPPEFTRAERFDAIFFLDLPTNEQKKIIWDMYGEVFNIPKGMKRPTDKDWTGAEIKACCRLASMLDCDLLEASENIVPVAITAGEKVESLRKWATGRCLSSEKTGLYHYQEVSEAHNVTAKPSRNIKRPSDN